MACVDWIEESVSNYTYSNRISLQNFQTKYGYNRHILSTETRVKKGQIVVIWSNFPIAIDVTNNHLRSDYQVSNRAIKLNYKYNWRLYVNALIKNYFYLSYFLFNQSFVPKNSDVVSIYNLSARYLNSNYSVTKSVNITNCNF